MTSISYLASVTCASTAPLSILPAANGRVYCVNGKHRGVVYTGTSAYQIGLTQAQTITASSVTGTQNYYVAAIEVRDRGTNVVSPPAVTITGVTSPKAELLGGGVQKVTFLGSATTHTSPPNVTFTGGRPTAAALSATVRGGVANVRITNATSYFSSRPAVTFTAASGVTTLRGAAGYAVLNKEWGATTGPVSGVVMTDRGDYRFTGDPGANPVTVSVSGCSATPQFTGIVESVTVGSSGSGYGSAPKVKLVPSSPNRQGGGAAVSVVLTSTGNVTSPTVKAGGNGYDGYVDAQIEGDVPVAECVMAPRLAGKYLCGVRYVGADGVAGNLCELSEVDCKSGANSITWDLSALTWSDGTPNRVAKIELWRTTSDEAITLYRIASIDRVTTGSPPVQATSYTDSMPDFQVLDDTRSGYADMPILTAEGHPYANRYGVPPSTFSTACMFEDRVWYAVDESGAEPNAIYFSEVDEPESVPSEYQLIIQSSGRESDRITGLIPLNGALYVAQQRNLTRLVIAGHPLENATATPVVQRGLLNDRCWDKYDGIVYLADGIGLYAFDGTSAKPLSDPVKEFWTDPQMNFARASSFHLRVNQDEQVVRLYYVRATDSGDYPTDALCYSLITQAWWTELYYSRMATTAVIYAGDRPKMYTAHTSLRLHNDDISDAGESISYSLRTGNFPLNNDPKRGCRLIYTPCSTSQKLLASMYYNGSSVPRATSIASNRGTGFVSTANGLSQELDLSASRSTLGTATGFAQFFHAGRIDDNSAGGDRHLAIELSGIQSTSKIVLHSLQVEGVG